MSADLFLRSGAMLSPCGRYRYSLTRSWSAGQRVAWIMLNPSTADADADDPTIRRCIGFARLWRCGGLEVVNLFAFRATDPAALLDADDPIGPDNDRVIQDAASRADYVVLAWGAHVGGLLRALAPGRAEHVRRIVSDLGKPPICLGRSRHGHPRHPLMVPYLTQTVAA